MPAVAIDAGPEPRAGQLAKEDGQLLGGVDTVDVLCRVRFGVAELLRGDERLAILDRAILHPAEDVVGGAVEDAGDGGN